MRKSVEPDSDEKLILYNVTEIALFQLALIHFFKANLEDFSKEHGERFHLDIQTMEKRWQERWDEAIEED